VIVYSRDEYKQWVMARNVKDQRVRWRLGDVRDPKRTHRVVQDADVVIHAAALKHVTAMERNPEEAHATNVLGTLNVLQAVMDSPVRKAILLSTDKACMPVNLYGATKMVAERLWLTYGVHKPVFSFVRYGNVMESRGGVLGIWREDLLQGRVPKMTDPRMTRFWMSFEMAIQAVVRAYELPPGLAIVHKAPAIEMRTLALALGIPPADMEILGIQPGEKRHETLITEYEGVRAWDMGDMYAIAPDFVVDETVVYPTKTWTRMPEGFSYTSDGTIRLTVEDVKERI